MVHDMSEYQDRALNAIRDRHDCGRAVSLPSWLFGGIGTIPGIGCQACLAPSLGTGTFIRWAIPLRSAPTLLGVWSADPDLPIVATMLKTWAHMDPLRRYASLSLVAHSMGGFGCAARTA